MKPKFNVGDLVTIIYEFGEEFYRVVDFGYDDECGEYMYILESSDMTTYAAVESNLEKKENKTMRTNKRMEAKEERMNTLKANGQNTNNYCGQTNFTMEELMKMLENGGEITVNGVKVNFMEQGKKIDDEGYVHNSRTDSRWIPAQMFRALKYQPKRRYDTDGYTGWLKETMPYERQFRFMAQELKRIGKMEYERDPEFYIKTMFFNKEVVAKVCENYVDRLKNEIEYKIASKRIKVGTFERKQYVRLANSKPKAWKHFSKSKHFDVYIDQLEDMYTILRDMAKQIEGAYDYLEASDLVYKFIRKMPMKLELEYNRTLNEDFVNAYKGNGAYYTLRNLLVDPNKECFVWKYKEVLKESYWGCYYITEKSTEHYTRDESLQILMDKTRECCNEGKYYKLLGFMKEVIDDNNFDLTSYLNRLNK